MKQAYRKWGIYAIILCVVAFVISFAIGFITADEKVEEKPVELPVTFEVQKRTEVAPAENLEPIQYYLISEDKGFLKLYYIEGENISELRSEKISIEVFPQADISMLSEGIKTETSEEALEVWENFIS